MPNIFEQALTGELPADFDRWDLINPYYNLVILPEPQEAMK